MILKLLRNAAGYLIVFINWLTMPKAITRSADAQSKAQEAMQGLSLYQLFACPFCIKTRRALHRLNVTVDIHDIGIDSAVRTELESQGGRVQVPCLRIKDGDETVWMYESSDIIQYIEKRIAV
jgi:glutaredoxin